MVEKCFAQNQSQCDDNTHIPVGNLVSWKSKHTTLNQRWNTVDTSTLTVVEKWLSVWCFHDFEIMIVSCLFPSPHSIYWITIMLMQLNQRLHSRWTDAIIHGCALCPIVCTDDAMPHRIASVVIPNVYGRRPACCTENWSSYEWTLDRSDNWAGIGAFP